MAGAGADQGGRDHSHRIRRPGWLLARASVLVILLLLAPARSPGCFVATASYSLGAAPHGPEQDPGFLLCRRFTLWRGILLF